MNNRKKTDVVEKVPADLQFIDKKVAWVTPFLGRDGKLMYMRPLLSGLADHCKDFVSITAEYSGDTKNPPFKILLASRVRRLYMKGPKFHLKGFVFIGPSFMKSIFKSNAEVLFLVEFSLTSIYGLLVSAIKRSTKTILVMENKPLNQGGIVLRFTKKLLKKIIAHQCDSILTNNLTGKKYLIDELKVNPDKIIAKPFLVSQTSKSLLSSDERFLHLNKKSKINFLFVGQLIPRKGLQHLIEAVKLVPENDRSRIHIDVVGTGDYLDALLKQITDNKLESNFKFHGLVEYSELSSFYSSAHIFIFPTLYDYRALSPFEALAAGLPIISSVYDGGIYENVIEGENGYICDPLDAVSFSEALMKTLSTPEKLHSFSLKSLEIAKEYTIDNAVDSMLSAVHLALSRS